MFTGRCSSTKSPRCFPVHKAGGAGDVHLVPGQLEVGEKGDKNNMPGEARLCTISRGRLLRSVRCYSLSLSLSLYNMRVIIKYETFLFRVAS